VPSSRASGSPPASSRTRTAAPVALKLDRPNGPSRIELAGQRIFVLETRQGCGRDILARRFHDEHTASDRVRRAGMHSSIQDELAILMDRLERVVRKIHHSATTERLRCAPALVTADSK
jgi:hypothetical protein